MHRPIETYLFHYGAKIFALFTLRQIWLYTWSLEKKWRVLQILAEKSPRGELNNWISVRQNAKQVSKQLLTWGNQVYLGLHLHLNSLQFPQNVWQKSKGISVLFLYRNEECQWFTLLCPGNSLKKFWGYQIQGIMGNRYTAGSLF